MKYNFKLLQILFFIAFISESFSQKVIISEDPPMDFKNFNNEIGPNQNKFNYFELEFGGISKYQTLDPIPFQFGIHIGLSRIQKRKINNILAFHYGLEYSYDNIYLKQEAESYITNLPTKAEDLKYHFSNINSAIGFQINFDKKRGNQLGKYLSIGGFFGFNYANRLTYNLSDQSIAKKVRINQKNLNHIMPFQYGISAKMMLKKIGLFINYRISNLVEGLTYGIPKISCGLNITINGKTYR